MKIAVFGDSFACSHDGAINHAWYNLFAEKIGGVVVAGDKEKHTYGIPGVSTFVSYKKFLHHYKNYDFTIFVCCDPTKYTKPVMLERDGVRAPDYISGITNLNWTLSNRKCSDDTIETLENLKKWFTVNDTEFMELAQTLILDDIQRHMGNKGIILPVTLESLSIENRQKFNIHKDWSLWSYHTVMAHSLTNKKYDTLSPPKHEEIKDKIACHLTPEANEQLANDLYEYYSNKKILVLPKTIKHNYDIHNYYTVGN